ncbi:phytanoyl-CoA dioxygenase family protein [Thalassospira povalilytica]|uniref:hypothetical protein n=1 Tax=Thalassospira povalilytica TaxID=732237 RepID=UPI001D18D58E|nr:hypothetical protein [Thalassospira povalilytica]MCC4241913.1 hypothetical protein [Thalassospira povalilytica]
MAKDYIKDFLEDRSFDKYQTAIGWQQAPVYHQYHQKCKEACKSLQTAPDWSRIASEFKDQGIVSIQNAETIAAGKSVMETMAKYRDMPEKWSGGTTANIENYVGNVLVDFPELRPMFEGTLKGALEAIYGSYYKLLYAVMMYSHHQQDSAVASQLWHSDAGPGTCINVMFLPHGVSKQSGALQAVHWRHTKSLLRGARKYQREHVRKPGASLEPAAVRRLKCDYYENRIANDFTSDVIQPEGDGGMLVLFRNNCIHRGGFPAAGHDRYAFIFHMYPGLAEPDFDRYFTSGCPKTVPYPKDPNF